MALGANILIVGELDSWYDYERLNGPRVLLVVTVFGQGEATNRRNCPHISPCIELNYQLGLIKSRFELIILGLIGSD